MTGELCIKKVTKKICHGNSIELDCHETLYVQVFEIFSLYHFEVKKKQTKKQTK